MEIFKSIVNNCISRWIACFLSMTLWFILTVGCTGVVSQEIPVTNEGNVALCTDVDAVSCADPGTDHSQDERQTVFFTDLSSTTATPEQEEALLREHNRTQMETKLLGCKECEGMDWETLDFDLFCKTTVSESKVRQGIFHFRLQSDDEEAPIQSILRVA